MPVTVTPGVQPYQILVGPAHCWLAVPATTFPDIVTDPAAGWTYLGKTDGQTLVDFAQTVNPIFADQVTGPLKAVRTQEMVEVTLNFIELTLETFKRALNNATVTVEAGPPADKVMGLYQGVQVAEWSMLVRFDSAYSAGLGQLELPVVIQTLANQVNFTRDNKSVFTTKWMSIEDPNAATDAEKFGRLRMAT